LLQTPDSQNFATTGRSSKCVINLARQKGGRLERDKLESRRSTKLTIPSTPSRPLVYHSDRQEALSTARFRRAGLLATADTRYNTVINNIITFTIMQRLPYSK